VAFQTSYQRDTVRVSDTLIPGNSNSDSPVEFDICPAWGADIARIKSIIYATLGLAQDGDWSPEVQANVIEAFGTGGAAFVNTVERIRNLTVPAVAALRAGLITELPKSVKPGDQAPTPDHEAPFPITNGTQFAKVCGGMLPIALEIAFAIGKLDGAKADARFFGQPSGSGETATGKKAGRSTAGIVPRLPRRRVTAGKGGRKGRTGGNTPTQTGGSTTGT
jgi:hypothetical protein